jgi:hypothetical protein
MLPASELKSISLGLLPTKPPAMSTGAPLRAIVADAEADEGAEGPLSNAPPAAAPEAAAPTAIAAARATSLRLNAAPSLPGLRPSVDDARPVDNERIDVGQLGDVLVERTPIPCPLDLVRSRIGSVPEDAA